jgi:hypothetical protein
LLPDELRRPALLKRQTARFEKRAQDAAEDFYVNKLGFELKTDATMDNGFRWLTVAPKGQPDLEIVLITTTHPK